MIKFRFIIFLYLCIKSLDAIPTGTTSSTLEENSDDILYVPAIPRFPGARPLPEATTFLPNERNQQNDSQEDSQALRNGQHVLPKSTACRTVYETVYDIQEIETEEEKCNTIYE